MPAKPLAEITEKLSATELSGAEWKQLGGSDVAHARRRSSGSANWTHEHADAANSRVSADQLVKAPLVSCGLAAQATREFFRGTATVRSRK